MRNVLRVVVAAVAVAWASASVAAAPPVSFSKIAVRLAPGAPWWTTKSGTFCEDVDHVVWDPTRANTDPAVFEPAFREAMTAANFQVAGDQDNLFEERKEEGEYIVGGVITEMTMTTCYNSGLIANTNIRGKAQMSVEWQVYSKLERKVIARMTTTGSFSQDKPIPNTPIKIVLGAFTANAQALAKDDTFRAIFSSPARSPTEALKPTAQATLPFTGGVGPRKIDDAAKAVVLVLAGESFGSGVLVAKEGYLLTNEHVVGGAKYVKIRWSDGAEGLGEVLRTDRRRDVAVIKVDPQGRLPLAIKTSPPPSGDPVFAIGAPLQTQFQSTVTRGVISASRTMDGLSYIQSDVAVNHGNSGGALLDDKGAVVAITVLGILNREGGLTNVNMFIPIADALSYLGMAPL